MPFARPLDNFASVTSLYPNKCAVMDIARGGSFARADKKAKAKTSTKGGEKKKEPQSKIIRVTQLAKSLYRNDFARLATVCTVVSFQNVLYFVCTGA